MKFRGWRIPAVFQGARRNVPLTGVSSLPILDSARTRLLPTRNTCTDANRGGRVAHPPISNGHCGPFLIYGAAAE